MKSLDYTPKYAYSELDKEYSHLSPVKLISLMFEKTEPDGTLIVPGHPYRTSKSMAGKIWFECKMNWTEEDRDEVISEYRRLFKILLSIADSGYRLGDNPVEAREVLSPEQYEVWYQYLRDIQDGHFEKDIERCIDRMVVDTVLAKSERKRRPVREARHRIDKDPVPEDEEIFRYWKYVQSLNNDIKAKFGNGKFAFDVCIRMKRFYYLLSMEAPGSLANREARLLAKYMVLDKYCEKADEVETYTGYGFPLHKVKNVRAIEEIICSSDLYGEHVSDWEDMCETGVDYGEELVTKYDQLGIPLADPGCEAVAFAITCNRELNPLRLDFGGFSYACLVNAKHPDLIICFDESGGEDRPSDEEVLNSVKKIAAEFGINKNLVKKYEIVY